MSGTVCCYKGCDKSYSTDKDVVVFFKFPDDPKRRKKWMENCSNSELLSLNDRQLRLKRVCSDHFAPAAFISAETRNQLTEKAVPLSQKEADAAKVSARVLEESQQVAPKRGRGRPPKASGTGTPVVKKEVAILPDIDDEDEDAPMNDLENGDDDIEYAPPPMLRRQIKQENDVAAAAVSKPKEKTPGSGGKPPKLVAATSTGEKPNRGPTTVTPSSGPKIIRKRADANLISDVVKRIRITSLQIEEEERLKKKKLQAERAAANAEKKKLEDLKRLKDISDGTVRIKKRELFLDDESEEDGDDGEASSGEEELEGSDRANREFERFQLSLRDKMRIPHCWGMGGVIWDPLNKMKVIVISEPDVQANGTIRLKRAVQIFEDSNVKILIDGVDMTLSFDVKPIGTEDDASNIVDAVSKVHVCTGIAGFTPDDRIYLPFAKKRGCRYFSDACPVIVMNSGDGEACGPCASLLEELTERKEKEKEHVAHRRSNPVTLNIRNEFGKSMYGLLNEIFDDAEHLKSDKKQDRDAVLSKYSNDLSMINGEVQKPEKLPHLNVSVDEVSASFQDIVSRLGFSTKKPISTNVTPVKESTKLNLSTSTSSFIKDLKKKDLSSINTSFPRINTKSVHISTPNHMTRTNTTKSTSSTTNTTNTNFSVLDGQEYEVIGEVEGPIGNEVVQMVDMAKSNNKQDGIEIIEVDDETMAKLTASNPGLFFQNQTQGGPIQVTALDPSDPNLSHILTNMNPTSSVSS